MNLRPYQKESISSLFRALREDKACRPCLVLPTGAGKGFIIGEIAKKCLEWGKRLVVLAHVKELIEQNSNHASRLVDSSSIGIYSAGLRQRDTKQEIICAGIQSVYKKADIFGSIDLILVDECHLIDPEANGMFGEFLRDALIVNPECRIAGMTATPYRMKDGLICSHDNMLSKICYEAKVKDLIEQKYLSPLISFGSDKVDSEKLSSISIRNGDYALDELEDFMEDEQLVKEACEQIVERTDSRRSVLVFCVGIDHAKAVAKKLQEFSGKSVAQIYGSTQKTERSETIAKFKCGQIKYLVNVGVLTTGFDAPAVDCVVMLRPTQSAGLYYQMVGRGFRLAPEKANCLILDYGNNILEHGPVDAIEPRARKSRGERGEAPMKKCPSCDCMNPISATYCENCLEVFPREEKELKHTHRASKAQVVSGEPEIEEYEVTSVFYYSWLKKGGDPDEKSSHTLCVSYNCGFRDSFREWVCPNHEGFAREKFESWWKDRSMIEVPENLEQAERLARDGALSIPSKITVQKDHPKAFPRIIDVELGPKVEFLGQKVSAHSSNEEDFDLFDIL